MEEQTRRHVGAVAGTTAKADEFRRLADERLVSSYRLAYVILDNHAEAEDAVHDAFLTAWRKWGTLRDPQRFDAWFQRIVVNTCRDRLRKVARHPSSDLDDAPPLASADAYAGIHDRDIMSRAFARLEPDHRIVLALRYYRDMQVDDIASLLGVRSGTVKSRLSRAQARMRRILDAPEAGR